MVMVLAGVVLELLVVVVMGRKGHFFFLLF